MKRFILASALVAASAFGAAAQDVSVALSSTVQAKVLELAPGVDLANLTASQYARLTELVMNADNLKPGNYPKNQIDVIIGQDSGQGTLTNGRQVGGQVRAFRGTGVGELGRRAERQRLQKTST